MKKNRIYIDNSSLNRPFDDYSHPKIKIEAVAVLLILRIIEEKKSLILINSDIIIFENSKNPYIENKMWIEKFLNIANYYQKINSEIKKRAEEIEKMRIQSIDALHLSSAEYAKADYFITSDRQIIKNYKGQLKIVLPNMFLEEINI